MITKNLTIMGLYIISLTLTPFEQFENAVLDETRLMAILTTFAAFTLIIAIILLFWARDTQGHIAKLKEANEKLLQVISEIKQNNV